MNPIEYEHEPGQPNLSKDEILELRKSQIKKALPIPKHISQRSPESQKRLELHQKKTFEWAIKRRHKHLIPQWKDLFAEYFIDLLAGDVKSINDFLYVDRLGMWEDSNLKPAFSSNPSQQ